MHLLALELFDPLRHTSVVALTSWKLSAASERGFLQKRGHDCDVLYKDSACAPCRVFVFQPRLHALFPDGILWIGRVLRGGSVHPSARSFLERRASCPATDRSTRPGVRQAPGLWYCRSFFASVLSSVLSHNGLCEAKSERSYGIPGLGRAESPGWRGKPLTY